MTSRVTWQAWDNELMTFRQRDTEGFTKDLKAFETHILKLQEVCPKDKAGWPLAGALEYIDNLQNQHAQLKKYLDTVNPPSTTP